MSNKRAKTGQVKHDTKVGQRANYYKNKGATFIRTDLRGGAKPPKLNGRIPDLYVRLNGELFVEEIETKDSLTKDQAQQEILKNATKKRGGKFKVIVAK
jgi:hypothetical protein